MIRFDNTNISLVNGQNGNLRTISTALTKPTILSSNSESTNGNGGILSAEKRARIVISIPNLTVRSNKVIDNAIYRRNSSFSFLACSIAR